MIKWTWVVYSLVGLVTILMWLLISGHANGFRQGDAGCTGCPDRRVKKAVLSFGGSAGLTFGWHYVVVAYMLPPGHVQNFFWAYGQLHFWLSAFNAVSLLAQLRAAPVGVVPVKAHLQGCGFTTAWSPLWPLFWLGKIYPSKKILVVRDLITRFDWVVSLPAMAALSVIARVYMRRWLKPVIAPVDHGP